MNYASLFTADVTGAAFDAAIEMDASNGRVNHAFRLALETAYGVSLPASPAQAVSAINRFLAENKAPKLAAGPGSRAAALTVVQAMHALATILHTGKAKGVHAPLPLPAWADPVALADKVLKAKQAREAKKAAAPAVIDTNATVTAPIPAEVRPVTDTAALSASVNAVIAAAKAGVLTAKQITALRAVLDTAQSPAVTPAKAHKAMPVTVTAPEPALH